MSDCTQYCEELAIAIQKKFVTHPNQGGETWLEHCNSAIIKGVKSVTAGVALIVHGIFPFAFKDWGNNQIIILNAELQSERIVGKDK